MSAPLRYRVTIMVGRTLGIEIPARDERAAEDIATYLYERFGDRFFSSDAEQLADCIVDPTPEVVA